MVAKLVAPVGPVTLSPVGPVTLLPIGPVAPVIVAVPGTP